MGSWRSRRRPTPRRRCGPRGRRSPGEPVPSGQEGEALGEDRAAHGLLDDGALDRHEGGQIGEVEWSEGGGSGRVRIDGKFCAALFSLTRLSVGEYVVTDMAECYGDHG